MLLSILIPTIDERRESFKELILELTNQILDNKAEEKVEIISLCDKGILSIGAKRNELLMRVKREYFCFIDDDDTVSSDYITRILEGLETKPDCCSLRGVYTTNGTNPELFEHSIKYSEYKTASPTSGIRYERYPNHLNVIKTLIGQQFTFPETNHGEDTEWATKVFNSRLLRTEYFIPEVIYHYQFKNK